MRPFHASARTKALAQAKVLALRQAAPARGAESLRIGNAAREPDFQSGPHQDFLVGREVVVTVTPDGKEHLGQ